MLGVMSLNVLQAYEEFIEKVTKRYVGAWHLIASADDRARSEQLGRLRLKVQMGMASGAQPPDGWSASKPWGALMTMLLRDKHFWQEQLHQPALTWMARGMRGIPKSPMEAYMEDVPTPTAEGTKEAAKTRKEARKTKRTADREELRRLRATSTGSKQDGGKGGGKADGKGNQRCFGWNNGNGPCAGLSPGSPCQAKVPSIHECTICGSPGHPSKDCPQKKKK